MASYDGVLEPRIETKPRSAAARSFVKVVMSILQGCQGLSDRTDT